MSIPIIHGMTEKKPIELNGNERIVNDWNEVNRSNERSREIKIKIKKSFCGLGGSLQLSPPISTQPCKGKHTNKMNKKSQL